MQRPIFPQSLFSSLIASSVAFLVAMGQLSATPVDLHVSPSGKVGASGSSIDPFPSLKDAVSAIAALPSDQKAQGVTVSLSGGIHHLPRGVVIGPSCSGTSGSPVIIMPEQGASPFSRPEYPSQQQN